MWTPFSCILATQSYNRKMQSLVLLNWLYESVFHCQFEYILQAVRHLADRNTEAEGDKTTVPTSASGLKNQGQNYTHTHPPQLYAFALGYSCLTQPTNTSSTQAPSKMLFEDCWPFFSLFLHSQFLEVSDVTGTFKTPKWVSWPPSGRQSEVHSSK